MLRQQNSLQTARIARARSNLSHGGNATPSRATRCLVQQLRVATSCMARAPRVAARWKCCNNRARPPQI
jgi:hypothetical protein